MAKKEAAEKAAKKTNNDAERTNDKTYRAFLDIGGVRVATITLRAEDDDDAREQLKRSRPSYFEGIGEWSLTRMAEIAVEA